MHKDDLLVHLNDEVNDLIKVLEYFGFHSVSVTGEGFLRCSKPDSDRNDSIAINLYNGGKPLYCTDFSSGSEGDLYDLIGDVKGYKFSKVLKHAHQALELEYEGYWQSIDDTLRKLKWTPRTEVLEVIREVAGEAQSLKGHRVFELDILDSYIDKYEVYDLWAEGIIYKYQRKYLVCIDPVSGRILFPHLLYSDATKVVGIQARSFKTKRINPDDSIEYADDQSSPKYINLISGYKKKHNLYGLSFPLPLE